MVNVIFFYALLLVSRCVTYGIRATQVAKLRPLELTNNKLCDMYVGRRGLKI